MALADYFPHLVRLSSSHAWVKTVRAQGGSLVRVLEAGNVYQSATYFGERWAEPVFEYYRSFDTVFSMMPEATKILMIGGGGYAWPKHVVSTQPSCVRIDVCELEPAITKAAQKWFFLDRAMKEHPGQIGLLEGDGRAYLESCDKAYDAIVVDAFAGSEPVRSLATLEAARAAKTCLVPGGVLAANVVSAGEGSDLSFLRSVVATWREVFGQVYVTACEEDPFALEDNYLVLASESAPAPADAIPYGNEFLGDVLFD